MKRRLEQKIDAYRDGALSERGRDAFERRLAGAPDIQAHLRRSEALGRAVREVWGEGPPAPRVDLVIQALRPEMARVDAENAQGAPLVASLRDWLGRARDLLGPVPLAAAGAAAALALALAGPGLWQNSDPASGTGRAVSVAGIGAPSFSSPSGIYDLSQDAPLMIFQGEAGETVIWILEAPDSQSLAPLSITEF